MTMIEHPPSEWETLVARYLPPTQRICNCRRAYEKHVHGGLYKCPGGCTTAQLIARDHVAKSVLAEFLTAGESQASRESPR